MSNEWFFWTINVSNNHELVGNDCMMVYKMTTGCVCLVRLFSWAWWSKEVSSLEGEKKQPRSERTKQLYYKWVICRRIEVKMLLFCICHNNNWSEKNWKMKNKQFWNRVFFSAQRQTAALELLESERVYVSYLSLLLKANISFNGSENINFKDKR